jgi:hypothetical protein
LFDSTRFAWSNDSESEDVECVGGEADPFGGNVSTGIASAVQDAH